MAQELRFQQITTDDGLSDNAITCVFEDRVGYIWIGTEHGLNRYDGQRVEHFPPGTTGPEGIHISSIAEDGTGRLWVTTADGGLSMRDQHSGRFTHFRKSQGDPNSQPGDLLNHVLVVNDTLLVVSSQEKGAIWFNTRRNTFVGKAYRPLRPDRPGDKNARPDQYWSHRVVRLDDHRLWIPLIPAYQSYILNAFTGAVLDTIRLGPIGFLPTNALVVDSVLYAGGWSPGLYRIPIYGQGPPLYVPLEDEVTGLVQWNDGRMLAGTKVNGLLFLDKEGRPLERSRHVRAVESSLCNDRVHCLLKDRKGNLWVGTANGLSVYVADVWRFTTTPLLSDNDPGDLVFQNIQQDFDGAVRISTSAGFVIVDARDLSERTVPLEFHGIQLEATGLFQVGTDTYYLGTETGLFRYDPRQERILTEGEAKGPARIEDSRMFQVRSVFQQRLGNRTLLMIGVLGSGQVGYDATTGAYLPDWDDFKQKTGTLMLNTMLRDSSGHFWSASRGGVVHWEPAATGISANAVYFNSTEEADRRLPGNDASSMVLHHDTVWVGMRDAGLAAIVDERAFAHVPPVHMPHDVLGVAVDHNDHVWCTTSNGLLRYDPRHDDWLHVQVNDGRRFRQLSKCVLALRDGRIAFCADNHLVTFDPKVFDALPELPEPTLVDVRNSWGTLPMSGDAGVEIPYRSSAFDASITALRTTGAMPLTFLYRLEGIDEEARVIGAHEPIRYAGVPVGTHRLIVRVRDAYGREGPGHVLLAVTVTGPFWQRWWFFVLVLAAGALSMYLFSRLRQKQRMKLQGVRDRIARDLHDDIGSTLGSISFYSEALKRKLGDTDDAMAQQVAERIGSSSRDMIDQMSDIVWSVDPKNDDAGALSTRLQAFASDLLAARNITLRFEADAALNERKLTAEQRRNLFVICKEVLHNAVKYADACTVIISLKSSGRALVVELEDDGKGFDPSNTDSYNGNGLPNMRVRAEAIGATFTIDSAPGKGTRARIVLPQNVLTPRSGD
jgi:signal transduction histidine kinase/ligand-binding sensor domain-containing protein